MDRQTKLLPLIAAFKIIKACLLFTIAIGFHHLFRSTNVEEIITGWAKIVRIDPDSKYAQVAISKVTGLSPDKLHKLGIGSFLYGLMFAIEGVGLLLKQRWAEYMTILTTVTFLPLEVWELVARPHRKAVKALVLLANIAILIYLLVNLLRQRKDQAAVSSSETPSAPFTAADDSG